MRNCTYLSSTQQLNEDRFEEVYNMIWYLMDKKDLASITGDEGDRNLSSDERNKRAMIFINLKETVCETLGKAWPADSECTQRKYQQMFVARCVQCLQNNTRPVQLALLVALGKFVERLKILEANTDSATGSHEAAGKEKTSPPAIPITAIDSNKEKKQKIESGDVIREEICKNVLSAVVYVSGKNFSQLESHHP